MNFPVPLPTIVQPPVSDHPKCKGLVVSFGRWSLMRGGPQERNFKINVESLLSPANYW